MKLSYYHKALIVAVVGIMYTNLPMYLDVVHESQILDAPKDWMLLLGLLSLPVLARQRATWTAFTSPVTIWCLGYAWVTVVWFLLSSQSDTTWLEVRNRFYAIIQILTFMMIFWEPGAIRLARKMLVGGVLFAVALNLYELFFLMSFNSIVNGLHAAVPGRSAGLYLNPSMAGEALVLGMILSVTILQPRYRATYILLTGVGVLITFSRGGILTWVIAVAGLMLARESSLKELLLPISLSAALGILVVLPRLDQLLTTWERAGVLNSNVLERLEWFTDPSGISDHSSWERKYLVRQAWDKIAERPLLGNGTGSSLEAVIPPHNQFFSFMLDHGIMGIMILPLLMFAATWNAWGETKYIAIIFSCALMMLSLFTHTILNTPYSLLLISLVSVMVAMSRNQESQTAMAMERKGSVAASGLVSA